MRRHCRDGGGVTEVRIYWKAEGREQRIREANWPHLKECWVWWWGGERGRRLMRVNT